MEFLGFLHEEIGDSHKSENSHRFFILTLLIKTNNLKTPLSPFTGSSFIFLLIIIFQSHFLKSFGGTWINTNYYENNGGQTLHNDSLHVGPLEMCKTPNGHIISLVRVNQDIRNDLIMSDSTGNLSWNLNISQSGANISESAFGLHPTADNGCVIIVQHTNLPFFYTQTYKINQGGLIAWVKTDNYPFLVSSIVPTPFNTYLIYYSYQDSLVEVGSSGNFIRNRFPFSGTIAAMQDSDFIVFTNSNITRQDFTGNIKWTNLTGSYMPFAVDTNFIYCKLGSQIMKLRTIDGSQLWTKTIPHTGISITSDSGLIACGGTQPDLVSKYDSAGNLTWSRSIHFPEFGYKNIIEERPNSYITGGAFKCMFLSHFQDHGFTFFLTSLDSSGHGVIDSTDHFFNSNANDNLFMSFADDGAFIAAALGSTGIPRSNVMQNWWQSIAVFCTDWQNQFPVGINYKYSDFDGNGLIDTNDLKDLSNTYPNNLYTPSHWRLANNSSTIPTLSFNIASDTIFAGDTATFYITAGSNSIPVDSIYSISMSINYNYLFFQSTIKDSPPLSGFGDPAVNLYSFFSDPNPNTNSINYAITRTDGVNAYLNGDTLAILRIPTSLSPPPGLKTFQVSFHAITKGGFDVMLDVNMDSVYFLNPTLNVNDVPNREFNIYPNPSSGDFHIFLENEIIKELIVYNSIGKEVIRSENPGQRTVLHMGDYPGGFYYLKCQTANRIFSSKMQIVR